MRLSVVVLALVLLAPLPARAGGWPRAYVVDGRLAALRAGPDLAAPVRKRLRVGRAVAIVGSTRDRDGFVWARVAVTRRTRGWLLAGAVASPGDRTGEARLAARIAEAQGIARAELARLALDRFARLRPVAAAAMAEEAADAAERLTRTAAGRFGALDAASPAEVRALMLSDPALDRYSRLGITFEVDAAARRYLPRPVAAVPR
jgi:hypothetical protein